MKEIVGLPCLRDV